MLIPVRLLTLPFASLPFHYLSHNHYRHRLGLHSFWFPRAALLYINNTVFNTVLTQYQSTFPPLSFSNVSPTNRRGLTATMHSPLPILGLVFALVSATVVASPASSPFSLDVSAVEISQFLALRAAELKCGPKHNNQKCPSNQCCSIDGDCVGLPSSTAWWTWLICPRGLARNSVQYLKIVSKALASVIPT